MSVLTRISCLWNADGALRSPLRRVRRGSFIAALCCTFLLPGLSGCGGGANRRLSEHEALNYKLQLIRSNRGSLSPEQAVRFHRHGARTRKELDRAFAAAREATEAEAAQERVRFEAQRKAEAAREADAGGDSGASGETAGAASGADAGTGTGTGTGPGGGQAAARQPGGVPAGGDAPIDP